MGRFNDFQQIVFCRHIIVEIQKVIRAVSITHTHTHITLPIIQMGLRTKRRRPQKPIYFERHPADHSLIMYSTPKNTTRHISWNKPNKYLVYYYYKVFIFQYFVFIQYRHIIKTLLVELAYR